MVCGIANQRQTMGGKLARVAAGQRENLTLALHGAQAKAIIEGNIQRLVKAASSACRIRSASSGESDQTIEHSADRSAAETPESLRRGTPDAPPLCGSSVRIVATSA
jgi:hypothetical protein